MTAKPTEIKAMIDILNQDYARVEDAAKAAFEGTENLIAQRTNWVVSVVHIDEPTNTQIVQVYGIFSTRNQAEKAITNGRLVAPGGTFRTKGAVAQLHIV